ncbi:MAG: hypothetical protein MZU95_15625 [Desulfomicrobium escambiense]|nr:hypothetical protein [Desulfomicrobium escambiense]
MRLDGRLLVKRLECAAQSLHVERIREYSYAELAAEVARKKAEEEERRPGPSGPAEARGAARLERLIAGAWKDGRIRGSPRISICSWPGPPRPGSRGKRSICSWTGSSRSSRPRRPGSAWIPNGRGAGGSPLSAAAVPLEMTASASEEGPAGRTVKFSFRLADGTFGRDRRGSHVRRDLHRLRLLPGRLRPGLRLLRDGPWRD